MKRHLSILLLLILFLPAFFKVGVEVYYEWNKEYIAANLCVNKERPITMCYGRCFVDSKMQLIEQVPVQSSALSQLKFEISDFVLSNFQFETPSADQFLTFPPQQAPSLIEGSLFSVFRPPLG